MRSTPTILLAVRSRMWKLMMAFLTVLRSSLRGSSSDVACVRKCLLKRVHLLATLTPISKDTGLGRRFGNYRSTFSIAEKKGLFSSAATSTGSDESEWCLVPMARRLSMKLILSMIWIYERSCSFASHRFWAVRLAFPAIEFVSCV